MNMGDTKTDKFDAMVLHGLAPYLIEVVKAHTPVERGKVDISLSKNLGEVVAMDVSSHKVTNFKNGDNMEAVVVIADHLKNNLPEDESATNISFNISAKHGVIKKLTISSTHRKSLTSTTS